MTKEEQALTQFNQSLGQLKEEFHRTGRFDDANVKLDEILKLLTVKYFDLKNNTNQLSLENLRVVAKKKFGNEKHIAQALQEVFLKVASLDIFHNQDGTNIFGSNPHLNIQSVDDAFAEKIVAVINEIKWSGESKLDLLNEAFGHFVRDNFRNHKEDAQYMTPVEVVDAMVDMAIVDLEKQVGVKQLVIMDPTCGVGSFLTRASQKFADHPKLSKLKISYLGQDKVDRMVRMAKINFLFSGLDPRSTTQGNSILGKSSIDDYKGKVDLIITNPPFGAEFGLEELSNELQNFEILSKIKNQIQAISLNSELLMLDRSLKLLKPGGKLLIIVPDGVVSSGGLYEAYRKHLIKNYQLNAVIDLPSVTFAQAGTRTKCAIVYLEKPNEVKKKPIFMAVINDIGYEVKERLGSPVKIYSGKNQLAEMGSNYSKIAQAKSGQVLSESPSAVAYPIEELINGKWNANFYKAERINAVNQFDKIKSPGLNVKFLSDIAQFVTKERRRRMVDQKTRCISVLHVNEDSTLKIDELMTYFPTGPGVECNPGEILFSKINPRIPRVIVVPPIANYTLVCSSEFEIIKPKEDRYTYLLKTMLLSKTTQKQVQSLTSGTSSSHNRIKESELRRVQVLWPEKGTNAEKKMLAFAQEIKNEEGKRYDSAYRIRTAHVGFENLLSV